MSWASSTHSTSAQAGVGEQSLPNQESVAHRVTPEGGRLWTRCFYCPETDIFCFEIEHPVTKRLDKRFKRAVCRNCHRKLEFQRDIKGLTKNGQHDVNETENEKLKRYVLLMAEDLASVGEELKDCSDLSRETIVADYQARAASL